jgi:hypothetical protein
MFQTINNPSPLFAAPLKKKRGRPRKIKVEEEDESFAEPLVTFKVKDKGGEDWTIYRGPSFLAVLWFGSTPAPSPPVSRQ